MLSCEIGNSSENKRIVSKTTKLNMSNKIVDIKSARQEATEGQAQCLRCKKLIPKVSRKCPYCGVNYSKELSEIIYETSPRKKRAALVIIALLLILILLIVL